MNEGIASPRWSVVSIINRLRTSLRMISTNRCVGNLMLAVQITTITAGISGASPSLTQQSLFQIFPM